MLVRVTAGGIEVTEGGRRLTEAAATGGPAAALGEVRAYYDRGVLEVFARRDGRYDRVEAEVSGRNGAERARLTAWASGRGPDGSGTSPDRCRPGWGNDYFFPSFLPFLPFLATPITPLPDRKVNEMLTKKRQRTIDRYQVSNTL